MTEIDLASEILQGLLSKTANNDNIDIEICRRTIMGHLSCENPSTAGLVNQAVQEARASVKK